MSFLVFILLFLVYYTYDGYLRLLIIVAYFKFNKTVVDENKFTIENLPSVTILLTVYNEGSNVVEKIKDILEQDYPDEKLKVLVASDGSTDNTDQLVQDFGHPQVSLFRPEKRRGKSDTQNKAIKTISSELVLFTDCDTRFKANFIKELVYPFIKKEVGCTSGMLLFRNASRSNISSSQSRYWNYELQIRDFESKLGCLAVATGACMAVRLELFESFSATYGEDCIVPLDTVLKGYTVTHVKSAVAYDKTPETQRTEFKARVRMTLRNWQGTWSRPALLNPVKNPKYAFALWSHKILRWLTPVFLILATIISFITASDSLFNSLVIVTLLIIYVIALIGYLAEKRNKNMPKIVSLIYSFLLANTGFLVGLWLAIIGKRISIYREFE